MTKVMNGGQAAVRRAYGDNGAPNKALNIDWQNLPIFERYGGKRGKQALALFAAGQMLWPIAKWGLEKWKETDDFTITVPGPDEIYPDLHEWVLERIPEEERKALVATTETGYGPKAYDSSEYDEEDEVHLRYDGSRTQEITIEGHKVTVSVEREQLPERANLPENWRQMMEKITFTAKTCAGRDAIVKMISELLEAKSKIEEPPALYMPSRWGGEWTKRGDLPPRSIDSAILKEGQLERLIADLQKFLNEEQDYVRLSQPWHRGYLFHGAPGTGKTSVAKALANHFGLPTYYLPLGDIDTDTNLTKFVSAIKPRSVLLLEDVDVFHAATKRDESKKVSIAAMLNALDGLWTPHGLITIMTTNNKGALDDALIRAGRVDVDEEFTILDYDQAERIAQFFEQPNFFVKPFVGSSPSELTEALKRSIGYATREEKTLWDLEQPDRPLALIDNADCSLPN